MSRLQSRRAAGCGLCLAASVFVASCVRYEPRPISAEDAFAGFYERGMAAPGLRQFVESARNEPLAGWPPERWDLETLTLAALYYQPDLDLARAEWSVARAEIARSGQRPNPGLSVISQYNTTTPSQLISPWILGLGIDIPIETHGKRRHRVEAAERRAQAAGLELAAAAWAVRAEVRQRMLELYAARRRCEALGEQQRVAEDMITLLELRFEAGEAGASEVTRGRVDLDDVRSELAAAVRERAVARVLLARALGVPAAAIDGIELSFDAFERVPDDVSRVEAQRQALLGRPDVLAALSRYAASEADLRLEIARQYPDLHLGPGFELDQEDHKWTLGVGLELPLFQHNRGGIAVADARREQSAAEFGALQARVIGQLESALTRLRESREETAAADRRVEHLQSRERTGRSQLDAGDISRFEFDLVRLERLRAESRRLETRIGVQRALGEVEDAMQHPLEWSESLWLESPSRTADRARERNDATDSR